MTIKAVRQATAQKPAKSTRPRRAYSRQHKAATIKALYVGKSHVFMGQSAPVVNASNVKVRISTGSRHQTLLPAVSTVRAEERTTFNPNPSARSVYGSAIICAWRSPNRKV